MKIVISNNLTVYLKRNYMRTFTKQGDGSTRVGAVYYNPIKTIRNRIEKWHTDWAMARLSKNNCKQCGAPLVPNQ